MQVATPFLGPEALGQGALNRHQLRTRCRRLFPGVYVDKDAEPTVDATVVAAWLWSDRAAVVAGLAAAAMLGSKWVPTDLTVDLICRNTRPPRGIRCRNDSLVEGEVTCIRGMRVTTAERTAFDLARRGPIGTAVARVDALISATGIAPADVALVASRHPGSRGLRQLEMVLTLVDGGAESPKETWLRLLLVRDGLPAPRTQIEVFDGDYLVARLDMGWPELLVAVEYDGDQHRTDRRQYVRDVRRLEQLNRLGWIVVRVVKEDSPRQVVRRVREAVAVRQSRLNQGREFGPNPAQASASAHVSAVCDGNLPAPGSAEQSIDIRLA